MYFESKAKHRQSTRTYLGKKLSSKNGEKLPKNKNTMTLSRQDKQWKNSIEEQGVLNCEQNLKWKYWSENKEKELLQKQRKATTKKDMMENIF